MTIEEKSLKWTAIKGSFLFLRLRVTLGELGLASNQKQIFPGDPIKTLRFHTPGVIFQISILQVRGLDDRLCVCFMCIVPPAVWKKQFFCGISSDFRKLQVSINILFNSCVVSRARIFFLSILFFLFLHFCCCQFCTQF